MIKALILIMAILLPSTEALGSDLDLIEIDLSKSIYCQNEYGKDPVGGVILGPFIGVGQRELRLVDARGVTTAVHSADCDFENNLYICKWARAGRVTLRMDEVYSSFVDHSGSKRFIKGDVKLGIFRPSSHINCQLSGSFSASE